jgi:hypothetical protein
LVYTYHFLAGSLLHLDTKLLPVATLSSNEQMKSVKVCG